MWPRRRRESSPKGGLLRRPQVRPVSHTFDVIRWATNRNQLLLQPVDLQCSRARPAPGAAGPDAAPQQVLRERQQQARLANARTSTGLLPLPALPPPLLLLLLLLLLLPAVQKLPPI
jgi:hypothetical protein